jgi:hypothetical protein
MSQFVFPPLTANLDSEGENGGSLPSKQLIIGGYDGANVRAIKVDSSGELQVDVGSITPGTGATDLGKAIQSAQGTTDTGVAALVVRNDTLADLSGADGDYSPLQVNATGALYTSLATSLPAGSNAIGKLAANSGVDIGDVDVTSLPSIPAGTNSIGTVILGAGTAAIGKLTANSGVDIGDVDVTSLPSLPAGTNAIGKLVANSGVDIGDVDVTSIIPGVGATNLGKAIQSAQGTTDTGVPALVVRNDTLADLSGADGDYAPLQVNAAGALYVEVKTSALPSGAATEAKQDTIETTLTAIETDADTIAGAVSGTEMQVDVVASLPAGSNNIGDVDIASALPAGTNSIGTVILGAGTAAIGKLTANSGVDIGDVDVTSLPALPAGSNTIGKVDVNAIAPVDFLDSGLVNTGTANIAATGTTVVSSLAAACTEIEIQEDIGEFMSIRVGGTVKAYLPLGGGRVKVSLAATDAVQLYSETGTAISSGKIAINLLG